MPRRQVPDPLSRRIGERIRELRLSAGLTLEKLAYESELGSKGHLSDLERGLAQPTVGTLQTLARHFGLLAFDLLTFPEDGPRAQLVDASRHASPPLIERSLRTLQPEGGPRREAFRIVDVLSRSNRSRAVPLLDLEAAAGAFGAGRAVETTAWVILDGEVHARPGMFAARVVGHSMEPRIPSGAYCLFSAPVRGIPTGRVVLAEHRSVADPETGGSYSVKKLAVDDRKRGRVFHLVSENQEFPPIAVGDGTGLRIVAELVAVLGQPARRRSGSGGA